ncbi:MAG: nitrous oxide reductase family maturation protein NosD [Candidatus Zixiibacteriota bacterium]
MKLSVRLTDTLALMLLGVLLFLTSSATGRVLHVQPAGDITSIGSALALAESGDTIRVSQATYQETDLRIDKSVTLEGVDWPILDAAGVGPLVDITAPDVSITGIEFRNVPVSFLKENAAVTITRARNCEIRGNRFRDTFFAIYLAGAERCRIVRNEIGGSSENLTSAGNGIHLWQCKDVAITGNTIRGHRDGIYLEFVKHSIITNNISEQNLRYGLHFMFSDSCRYVKNSFVHNGSGVAVMYTANVHMEDNTFADSWGGASYGLLLKDIRDSRVIHNVFSQNSVGILMEGSDRVRMTGNRFTANGWALKIMANCVDSRIEDNDFIDNSFNVATNSRQSFSTFRGNYWSSYRGYDLDRDGFGDEPYRPVSLFSLLVESDPSTLVLVRSLLVDVLNLAERILPTLTPESLIDPSPRMRPLS